MLGDGSESITTHTLEILKSTFKSSASNLKINGSDYITQNDIRSILVSFLMLELRSPRSMRGWGACPGTVGASG